MGLHTHLKAKFSFLWVCIQLPSILLHSNTSLDFSDPHSGLMTMKVSSGSLMIQENLKSELSQCELWNF